MSTTWLNLWTPVKACPSHRTLQLSQNTITDHLAMVRTILQVLPTLQMAATRPVSAAAWPACGMTQPAVAALAAVWGASTTSRLSRGA